MTALEWAEATAVDNAARPWDARDDAGYEYQDQPDEEDAMTSTFEPEQYGDRTLPIIGPLRVYRAPGGIYQQRRGRRWKVTRDRWEPGAFEAFVARHPWPSALEVLELKRREAAAQ